MRRIVVPLLVPTVVVAVASCRDPAPDRAVDGPAATVAQVPSTTTSAAPPPDEDPADPAPATPESDEEAILAAVLGYWDAVTSADYSGAIALLERHASGEALVKSKEVLSRRSELGQSVRIPEQSAYKHELEVVAVEGDWAEVSDCAVDDTQLVDTASGRVLNDRVSTYRWRLVLLKGDSWRVDSAEVVQRWEGSVQCGS